MTRRRLLAFLIGEAGCPSCGDRLRRHGDYYVCVRCASSVDYVRGHWLLALGNEPRRLPSVLGLPFDATHDGSAAQ